jgi:hypothetical protein
MAANCLAQSREFVAGEESRFPSRVLSAYAQPGSGAVNCRSIAAATFRNVRDGPVMFEHVVCPFAAF